MSQKLRDSHEDGNQLLHHIWPCPVYVDAAVGIKRRHQYRHTHQLPASQGRSQAGAPVINITNKQILSQDSRSIKFCSRSMDPQMATLPQYQPITELPERSATNLMDPHNPLLNLTAAQAYTLLSHYIQHHFFAAFRYLWNACLGSRAVYVLHYHDFGIDVRGAEHRVVGIFYDDWTARAALQDVLSALGPGRRTRFGAVVDLAVGEIGCLVGEEVKGVKGDKGVTLLIEKMRVR